MTQAWPVPAVPGCTIQGAHAMVSMHAMVADEAEPAGNALAGLQPQATEPKHYLVRVLLFCSCWGCRAELS